MRRDQGRLAIETVAFEASPRPTIGVEWEFALVDRETADLVSRAGELFDGIRAAHPDIAPQVHSEMLRNTVEVVTGVCENTAEAMADLARIIAAVRETSDPMGVDLFGAGTHPFAQWNAQQLTDNPRYDELIARTQWWGRQMLIWGVHVHVGVNHRDKVLPIISALLNHYPHLLALSASSPMWGGHDTGYASTRAMMFQQLPTAGLPFQFERWSEFERFVHDQKTTGIIDHLNEIRWDIRPACHLGTIEVRICDGMSSFAELEAVVALIHCLVVWLDARLDAGRPCRRCRRGTSRRTSGAPRGTASTRSSSRTRTTTSAWSRKTSRTCSSSSRPSPSASVAPVSWRPWRTSRAAAPPISGSVPSRAVSATWTPIATWCGR